MALEGLCYDQSEGIVALTAHTVGRFAEYGELSFIKPFLLTVS
jgi:hypothetical protein